jgi:Uma2 family endonuclease
MAEAIRETIYDAVIPNLDHIITEDDEPVDNMFSAKQQRLLVEPLYTSWKPGRRFLADANVGIFNSVYQPPIVPDMFLSLDVEPDEDIWKKENRSYFMWKFGKPPEVVIEVVSNTKGGETEKKFHKYAQIGAWYYVIFDPQQVLQQKILNIYQLSIGRYVPKPEPIRQFTDIGLGLTLWNGKYEGMQAEWLRWCDESGALILTGLEYADQERQRAEKLAAQLRELGIEPDM